MKTGSRSIDEALARVRAIGSGYVLPQPRASFVIVCLPRTGSELLVDLLDSHPDIRCESELLHDPMRFAPRYLRGRAALAAHRGAQAWGAKIIFHQVSWYPDRYGPPEAFFARLARAGVRVVSLSRRNPLDQAISSLQAIERGRYHYRTDDAGGHDRLEVAPEALVSMLWTIEEQESARRAALRGLETVELVYEDDLAVPERQQSTVDGLATWLGLAPAPVRTTLERRDPLRPADRLADYDTVARTLVTTRYARLLEEASPGAGSAFD